MLFELFDRDRLTDDGICVELYAKRTQTIYLDVHDAVRQTELRDAVLEYAADLVQRFEYMHLVAVFGCIAGESQSGRTGTYDRDLGTFRSILSTRIILSILICKIRAETLEVADGYSGMTHLKMDTLTLALFLLRADTTADSRKRGTLFDDRCSAENVAGLKGLDEARDVDIHRTTLYAGRVLAVETTMGFGDGLLEREALVNLLVQTLDTHFRTQFRHLNTGDGYPIFWFSLKGRYFGNTRCPRILRLPRLTSFLFSCLICFERGSLFSFERFHAAEHLVPIDRMGIELRSIDADELGLTAYRDTARAAHTGTIDHDCIEAGFGRNVILGGREGDELHHDSGTDRDTFIDLLTVNDLLYTYGDNTLLTR